MANEKKRIEAIYHLALEKKNKKERSAYLDSACGDDSKLRASVEGLLQAHDKAGDFLEVPPFDPDVTLDTSPLTEGPGTRIGRYKLLQMIGEGGFGVVYMAEQEEPIRRRVALKIIKLGMDTKQVIARFEAERQALAMMDHPNIARVFDAGATDTGRPYFVMELVKGIPITEYCDKNNLDTHQRLDLFIDVCKAVQHAHQKGIIHRDIKPSNVMITLHDGKPVPKIIDFGIAKATQHRLTEKTLFTEYRQLIGTPEYMSPEQAEMTGLDVDTRSDIYSLGVLLYELLTGTTPFEAEKLRSAAYDEIRRIICEDEPPKPSTRLSTLGEALSDVAKHRQVQPGELCRIVRGDLDWVVMKSLEKDRTRRYETANEFAADIERHLGDEPVVAGPPSVGYRLSKFVRRNRALVTSVAVVLVVLAAGIVVSTIFAIGQARARAEEAVARYEAEQAEKVAEERAEDYRRSLYFNQIALADVAYRDKNARRLRELLDSCPEDLRGWEWNRLQHVSDLAHLTLSGHQSYVMCLAYCPDGKRVASGSDDSTVKVWDAASGNELMTLRGHEGGVGSVSFSSDGKLVVSGDEEGTLKVWDTLTGSEVTTLQAHNGRIRSVCFGPGGERIVSCGDDRTIKVWDTGTGDEVMKIGGQRPSSVASSPDGKWIASGTRDATLKLWDADTGAEVMTLRGRGNMVWSLAFSSDSKRIVSGDSNGTIKVWDIAAGAEVKTLHAHDGWVRSVSFSPDGERIVSCGDDNVIKVLDATTGIQLMTLHGHEGYFVSAVFSPEGKWIASAGDNTIKIWDASLDRGIRSLVGHKGNVVSVAFSPDGKRIVSGSTDKTVKVWDVTTGSEVMTLRGHRDQVDSKTWNPVTSVTFSPDGHSIVSGAFDHTIKVWDAVTGAEVRSLKGHKNKVASVAVSPDGTKIVSASHDKTIKLWDITNGAELMTFRGHDNGVGDASFSPDGNRIVSVGGTVKVWDVETGTELMTLDSGKEWVTCVSVSPSGTNIVSGYGDGTIIMWDSTTGSNLMTLQAHRHEVLSVAYSPDGSRIISGSVDQNVKTWDASTGMELITFQGGGNSIAFSPDGKTIAVGSDSDAIVLWESEPPVDGYEAYSAGIAARKLVDELYEKHGLYQKVIDELKADKTLAEPVRKVALQIANSRLWEDAEKLKKQSSESAGPEEVEAQ